jgi:hypothetical protein
MQFICEMLLCGPKDVDYIFEHLKHLLGSHDRSPINSQHRVNLGLHNDFGMPVFNP